MIPFPWGHRSQDQTSLNRPFPNRYQNRRLPALQANHLPERL
jgi:hypothetical protein